MENEQIPSTGVAGAALRLRARLGSILQDEASAGGLATALVVILICAAVMGNAESDAIGKTATAPDGEASSIHDPLALAQAVPLPRKGKQLSEFQPAGLANAKIEYAKPAPAIPFVMQGSSLNRERAVDCLASAVWYEAGNDAAGEKAVAQVVLNRLRHPVFPKTVCGVVFQGSELKTGCQFTFTCDGSRDLRRPSGSAMKQARKIAEAALAGAVDTSVGAATHYHADYVRPWWSLHLQPVSKVGAHIFYSWKGSFGRLSHAKLVTGTEAAMPATGLAQLSAADEEIIAADGRVELSASHPRLAGANTSALATKPANLPDFMQVDVSGASGRWAVNAMGACASRPSCLVLGYGDQNDYNAVVSGAAGKLARPLFLFARDGASGMEIALWDCDRAARPKADQCLPANGPALDRLMRFR